jgi:hypothetical protein
MLKRFGTITAVVVLIAGCVPPAPVHQMQTSFDPGDLGKYKRPGNASLVGQAFMRQQGGGVVTCAGEKVTLMADTAYVAEARLALLRGERLPPDGPRRLADSIVKETVCDAQGNFAFSGVVTGEYLLATSVEWQAGDYAQGGAMEKPITVSAGENKFILSR